MRYHFISDDAFFLLGLRECVTPEMKLMSFLSVDNRHSVFRPLAGDVVLLAIHDLYLRRYFIKNNDEALACCRLIVITDVPVRPVPNRYFPWILPGNISKEALRTTLQIASASRTVYDRLPESFCDLFERLCIGQSQTSMTDGSRSEMNVVYRLKRRALMRYGLHQCNPVGVILCRDILRMSYPERKRKSSPLFVMRRVAVTVRK